MIPRDCCSTLLALGALVSAALAGQPLSARTHLYPFGPGIGDQIIAVNDDGSSGKIPISTPFPYFDERHDSLYVSMICIIYLCIPFIVFIMIYLCIPLIVFIIIYLFILL